MNKLVRIALLLLGMSLGGNASALDDAGLADFEIDRMPNFRGLTGLFHTTSAYTLKAGELRLHASAIVYDDSNDDPLKAAGGATLPANGTLTVFPVSLTFGITNNWEIAFLGHLIDIEADAGSFLDPLRDVSAVNNFSESGLGDSEVSTKIQILTQGDFAPATAIGVSAIIATGEDEVTQLEDGGLTGFIAISAEQPIFANSFLGIYAEARGVSIDFNDDNSIYHDTYKVLSGGIRFPISNDNRLHLIVEGKSVKGKKIVAEDPLTAIEDPSKVGIRTIQDSGDYKSSTVGLRYAWRYLSISAGAESVQFKEDPAFPDREIDDSSRYFLSLGMGF